MSKAATKNLSHDAGTTYDQPVRFRDSNDVPVDLTGWTATFRVHVPGKENQAPVFTKGAGVTNDGWINIYWTDEESTANLPAKKYTYTLEVQNPSGDVFRLLKGQFDVEAKTNG